jgi:hypothetical protein
MAWVWSIGSENRLESLGQMTPRLANACCKPTIRECPTMNQAVRWYEVIRLSRNLFTITIFCLLSMTAARAQQSTGVIVGNVTDPSGAIVRGAKIVITNIATNTVRSTTSDGAGAYSVPALPAGVYTVHVEMSGFSSQTTDNITLEATETSRIDFKLATGSVQQTLTVEAASAATLQTENPTVGTTVDSKKIEDLPLNGRNFVQLTQLIPGVNPGTVGSITVRRGRGSIGQSDSSFGSTAAQANGQRDTQNRYFIENVEAMDYDAFTFSFSPSVDAISQFKVDTSGSGAEAGGAPGAYVNIILKSGTNGLHGTLWEFNRNNYFTSTYDAIQKKPLVAPRLNRNQFGGNIGGPVYIPHVYDGRNKTFFFFNAEGGYNLSAGVPTAEQVVPSAIRTGNFNGLVYTSGSAKGSPVVIYDPTTGAPFQGNTIPQGRWSPQIQTFLQYVPSPNLTGNANANYLTPTFKVLSHQYDYITRIDHTINTRNTLNGHYIHDQTYLAGAPLFGGDQDNNLAVTYNIAATYTHVFSAALVSSFTYGHHNFTEVETFGYTNNPFYDVANKMGIPLASTDPRFYGIPTLTISGSDGVYTNPHTPRVGPRDRSNSIDQGVDALSWQKGHHFLKAGFEIARRNDTFDQIRGPQGTFNFNGQYTTGYSGGVAIPGTGSALADFLLGYIQSDSINPTHTYTDISQYTQGIYTQDDWSIRPNLTINLGLRWDHWGQWVQNNNEIANFSLAANNLNIANVFTPANSPNGPGLVDTHLLDFQPRVGFAWQPYGTAAGVVLRGSYGLYFVPEVPNAFYQQVEGDQAQAGAALIGNGSVPNLTFSNPFPGVTTGGPSTYPFLPAIDPNLKDQDTQEWNLTMEKSLPGKILFDLGYVGAKGTHNFVWYSDLNEPIPVDQRTLPANFSVNSRRPNQNYLRGVQGDFSRGSSTYHSLQTKLDRRVGHGFTALVSYTWSKAISGPGDAGGFVGNGTLGANTLNLYDPKSDRSRSAYDIPNRFVGTVLYDVPFFEHTHGLVKLLADGFQVSTIVVAQSGPTAGVSDSALLTGTGIASRPDISPGYPGNLYSGRTYVQWFNPGAFQQAAYGTFGNSRRAGAVRLPGVLNEDFSAVKGFKLGGERNLQIRADIFNLWQHYNADPGKIGLARNASSFGLLGGGASDTASRIVQLAGKFYF